MAYTFDGPDIVAQTGTDGVEFVFNKDPNDTDVFERFSAVGTYTLLSGTLPTGMSIDATSGNPIGTPTEDGTFPNIVIEGTET
jgi:hypothetical protein